MLIYELGISKHKHASHLQSVSFVQDTNCGSVETGLEGGKVVIIHLLFDLALHPPWKAQQGVP